MTVGLIEYLTVAVVLFVIGFVGVLIRKNTLVIYMCLELMLVASTIAFVAFSDLTARWTATSSCFSS